MIGLPPGCSVCYNITIDIDKVTEEIIEWYNTIGGTLTTDEWYDHKGRKISQTYLAYNNYKRCHYGNGGGVRLHFLGKDASVASMFLLKFSESVVNHNLSEHKELQFE